jgi:hypothetical protein
MSCRACFSIGGSRMLVFDRMSRGGIRPSRLLCSDIPHLPWYARLSFLFW